MTTHGRLVVRLDSLLEAVLGAFCVALAVQDPNDGAWRLPAHLAVAVVWVLALGLLTLAVALWRWSAHPVPSRLIALAAGNAITALLIAIYLSFVDAGWAVDGLLAAAGLALAVLAVSQTATARRVRAATTPG